MNLRYFCLILAIFANFCQLFGNNTNKLNSFNKIWPAICKVESNNNHKAVGDGGRALGIAQIHLNYFKDATNYAKLNNIKYGDCFDSEVSKKIVYNYFLKYGSKELETGDLEGLAKLHNSGPNFRKKTGQAAKNLQTYWGKIQKELIK